MCRLYVASPTFDVAGGDCPLSAPSGPVPRGTPARCSLAAAAVERSRGIFGCPSCSCGSFGRFLMLLDTRRYWWRTAVLTSLMAACSKRGVSSSLLRASGECGTGDSGAKYRWRMYSWRWPGGLFAWVRPLWLAMEITTWPCRPSWDGRARFLFLGTGMSGAHGGIGRAPLKSPSRSQGVGRSACACTYGSACIAVRDGLRVFLPCFSGRKGN